uniref:Potassium channel domain-containing protein n=1 Tax=Felis catus TaxID=9685 RepID=A0ABI7XXN1_FELCA
QKIGGKQVVAGAEGLDRQRTVPRNTRTRCHTPPAVRSGLVTQGGRTQRVAAAGGSGVCAPAPRQRDHAKGGGPGAARPAPALQPSLPRGLGRLAGYLSRQPRQRHIIGASYSAREQEKKEAKPLPGEPIAGTRRCLGARRARVGEWAVGRGRGRGRGPGCLGRGLGGAEGRRGGGPRSGRSAAWASAVAALAAAAAAGEDAAVPGRQLVRAPGGAAPLGLVLRLPGARLPALPGLRRRGLLVGGAALRGPAAPGAAQAEAALPGGARVPVGAAARAVPGPRAGGQQLRRVGAQQRLGQLELGLHLRALLRQHRALHHRLWPHCALVRWRPVLYFHVRWGFSKQVVAIVHAVLLGFVTVSCFFFIPAAVFSILEDDWNFLESFYFCFISLSTIGLGDYVPGEGYNQKFRELYKIGITCYLLLGLIAMLVVLETFCELHELKKFRKMFYVKKDKDEDRVHIIEHDQLSFSSIADQAAGPKEDRKQNEPFVGPQSSAHPEGPAGN